MELQTYDYSHIVKITKEGIVYLDGAGQEAFLAFEKCRDFWAEKARMRWRGKPEQINWAQCRCVCESISVKSPMYFHFYGDTPVRFTFDARRSWWRRIFAVPPHTQRAFSELERRIENVGWSVFHIA